MHGGFAFLDFDDFQPHAWIVLSDPKQDALRVIVVNLTTWKKYHEQQCVLQAGCHTFVSRPTCVLYGFSRIYSVAAIETLIRIKRGKELDAASPALLAQLRSRVPGSRMIKLHQDTLRTQRLIP